MNNEQKERLEQELRFLNEGLEADVISRDEYERGKERIERKLKEIEESKEEIEEEKPVIEEKEKPIEEAPTIEEKKEEPGVEEKKPEEKEEEKEEIREEPKIEIKEIREERPKKIEEKEEVEEEKKPEEKEEAPTIEEKKEPEEEKKPEEAEKEKGEEIEISKKWLYGIAILIIIAILFFSIRGCKPTEEKPLEKEQIEEKPIEEELVEEFIPACSSNSDCKQEGMVGICLNPGTKEAKCEFKEDIRTNLIVVNDKDCKLCDSSGMKKIIKEIFPNVKINELDYETAEAKKLVNKFNINSLPAYIFDSNVSEAINFNDFKTALIKKGNNYIITNTASGAVYYFKRPLIENKLDLYVLPETTEKIEANMQEVLDLFKDKINFTKHIVTERQKEFLEKELAINTYPAFLLNNQLKFRGILPANIIKENICKVNYFEECSQELSKV